MENNLKTKIAYSLPLLEYSRLKWQVYLFGLIMTVLFIAASFLPIEEVEFIMIYKIICIACSFFFLYGFIVVHLFKLQYIKLTEAELVFKSGFGKKSIKYKDIYTINVYTQNNHTLLGIVSNNKMKYRKENLWGEIKRKFGGEYSISIPINNFLNLDIEKLYATLLGKLYEVEESKKELSNEIFDESLNINEFESYTNRDPGDLLIAIIKSMLVSVVIGLLYGASIYYLEKNIIFIPVLGTAAVTYVYSNNYKEERINYFIRFFIGIFCSMQVFIAVIVDIFLYNGLSINFTNLLMVAQDYIIYIFKEPFDQLLIIFIALGSFYWGVFQGKTFRLQRIINKVFMKKQGNYYYKKDGRIVDIYIDDPANFDDKLEKFVLEINEGCLISKDKKKVLGFLIPHKYIEEFSIIMNSGLCQAGDEIYNEINLGGGGEYQIQVLPCVIICNTNKEVEVIRIQI